MIQSSEFGYLTKRFYPNLLRLPNLAKTNAQGKPQDSTARMVTPVMVPDEKRLPSQTADLPPESTQLVHLLTFYGEWDRDLPIDQLRSAVSLLRHKAERHADRLQELDEIQGRIANYLKEIAQISWLEGTFSVGSYLSIAPDISVEAALEHLAVVEQEA